MIFFFGQMSQFRATANCSWYLRQCYLYGARM